MKPAQHINRLGGNFATWLCGLVLLACMAPALAATTTASPRLDYCWTNSGAQGNTNAEIYGDRNFTDNCFTTANEFYDAMLSTIQVNYNAAWPSGKTGRCDFGGCLNATYVSVSTFAKYPSSGANCLEPASPIAANAQTYCGLKRTDTTTWSCASPSCQGMNGVVEVADVLDAVLHAYVKFSCQDAHLIRTGANKTAGACANIVDNYPGLQECAACAGRLSGGNPIYPMTGAKKEVVLTDLGIGGQSLYLTYDTLRQMVAKADGLASAAQLKDLPSFGPLWGSSFHKRLNVKLGNAGIDAYRGDGRIAGFGLNAPGGSYVPNAGINDAMTVISGGYRYVDAAAGVVETYNSAGQLTTTADKKGNTLTFTYSTAAGAAAPAAGYLTQVTDNAGRSIFFTYVLPVGGVATSDGLISTVTTPDGRTMSAAYDGNKNLTALTWPDGKTRTFQYESTGLPWALTGKTDENNVRLATWAYDTEGRAISSDGALGTDHYSATYTTPPQAVVTETLVTGNWLNYANTYYRNHTWQAPTGLQVTDATGTMAATNVVMPNGYPILAGIAQAAGSGSPAVSNASTYDARGNLLSHDNFQGERACYGYDANNRETVRVEGLAATVACATVIPAGAALPANARKTITSWHPDWRLANKVTQPGRIASTVYHGQPDPFNNNAAANCTTAANLPNGKSVPLPCKQVVQSTVEAVGPVDPLSIDNYFQNNSLLLHGDGADGSTQMLDSSSVHRIVAPVRNSRISTAQSKFGGSSIFIPGTPDQGDYVFLNGDYTLPGDFTYEMWIRPGNITASTMLLVVGTEVAGQSYFMLANNTLFLGNFGGGAGNFNIAPAANVWSHIAFVRSGSSVKAYVNGVPGLTLTKTGTFGEGTRAYFGLSTASSYFDDIRLTNGVARYTAAFTPPTAPFGNTSFFTAPDAVTQYTYDASGRMLTAKDTLNRTTSYAYYTAASFSGTAPNETGHAIGDLQTVTNAAGHVTQFTLYDRAGRVKQMVDPRGVVIDTVYTPRGWVSSVAITPPGGTARTTSYTYDNAGQLTGATLPDGTTLGYSYDAAHRLTGVTDAKGNTITYTLDNMGNKTGEQVKDPSGTLQRNITRVYDALNRVQQVTGAGN